MTLTQKEHSLLNDLKGAEELCIEKYTRYASDAKDPQLKELFNSIKTTEQSHLQSINKMINGEEVKLNTPPTAVSEMPSITPSSMSQSDKSADAFLCKDALSMEKHVSSVYDISVFEFKSPTLRDSLAGIQKEEQNHGEKLYAYMAANGMYS